MTHKFVVINLSTKREVDGPHDTKDKAKERLVYWQKLVVSHGYKYSVKAVLVR